MEVREGIEILVEYESERVEEEPHQQRQYFLCAMKRRIIECLHRFLGVLFLQMKEIFMLQGFVHDDVFEWFIVKDLVEGLRVIVLGDLQDEVVVFWMHVDGITQINTIDCSNNGR